MSLQARAKVLREGQGVRGQPAPSLSFEAWMTLKELVVRIIVCTSVGV